MNTDLQCSAMNGAKHDFKQYNDTCKYAKCVFPLFTRYAL